MLYLDIEAQGRDSTFTICHALLKKAILEGKTATVPFFLNTAVCITWDWWVIKIGGQK